MLWSRVSAVAVAVQSEWPTLAQLRVSHLSFPTCVVGLPQVGFVNHAGTPATTAVVFPAVLIDDLVEVSAELLQGETAGDGLLDSTAHIRKQRLLGGARDHERPVMLDVVNIRPGASGDIGLASEIVDLFLERQRAVRDCH